MAVCSLKVQKSIKKEKSHSIVRNCALPVLNEDFFSLHYCLMFNLLAINNT